MTRLFLQENFLQSNYNNSTIWIVSRPVMGRLCFANPLLKYWYDFLLLVGTYNYSSIKKYHHES